MAQRNEFRSGGGLRSSNFSIAANQRAAAARKGKGKTVISPLDKPKQRGLGVAQLEKMRLQGQLANSGFLPTPHFTTHSLFQHQINEEMMIQVAYQIPAALAYSSPSSFAYGHPLNKYAMGTGDLVQPYPAPRWNPNANIMIHQPYMQQQEPSMVTRHLLGQVEQESRRNDSLMESTSSSSRNLELEDNDELDLELKL